MRVKQVIRGSRAKMKNRKKTDLTEDEIRKGLAAKRMGVTELARRMGGLNPGNVSEKLREKNGRFFDEAEGEIIKIVLGIQHHEPLSQIIEDATEQINEERGDLNVSTEDVNDEVFAILYGKADKNFNGLLTELRMAKPAPENRRKWLVGICRLSEDEIDAEIRRFNEERAKPITYLGLSKSELNELYDGIRQLTFALAGKVGGSNNYKKTRASEDDMRKLQVLRSLYRKVKAQYEVCGGSVNERI